MSKSVAKRIATQWPVKDGLIAGITGPSGVGKTSLLRTLCPAFRLLVLDADGHARQRLRREVEGGRCTIRRVYTYDEVINLITDMQDPDKIEQYPFEAVAFDGLTLFYDRSARMAAVEKAAEAARAGGKRDITPGKEERGPASDELRNIVQYLGWLADPDQVQYPRHVIMTCLEAQWKVAQPQAPQGGFVVKLASLPEGTVGTIAYGPHLPGKFADDYGGWLTEHYRMVVDPQTWERGLHTRYDGQFWAKGHESLEAVEPADLLHVIRKIYGEVKKK